MELVVTNHVTLDGVMQAPMGADEDQRGGFEHGGWAAANVDEVMAGEMGKGMGVFLAHPAFQDLAAYLETPGKDGHGPTKADLTRVRRLRTRSLAK